MDSWRSLDPTLRTTALYFGGYRNCCWQGEGFPAHLVSVQHVGWILGGTHRIHLTAWLLARPPPSSLRQEGFSHIHVKSRTLMYLNCVVGNAQLGICPHCHDLSMWSCRVTLVAAEESLLHIQMKNMGKTLGHLRKHGSAPGSSISIFGDKHKWQGSWVGSQWGIVSLSLHLRLPLVYQPWKVILKWEKKRKLRHTCSFLKYQPIFYHPFIIHHCCM